MSLNLSLSFASRLALLDLPLSGACVALACCRNNSNINRIILVRKLSVIVLNSCGEIAMLDLPIESHHCDISLLSDSESESSITD